MGQSFTLLKKDFLELSLEIDRDIVLELSTGFGSSPRPQTFTSIPITTEELKKLIGDLQRIHQDLVASWKCKSCGIINHKEDKVCYNCD